MTQIRPAVVALALGVLVSCSSNDSGTGAANMALACQTMPCACVSENSSFVSKAKTTEILWKSNGDAYCPKGFALEKAAKK